MKSLAAISTATAYIADVTPPEQRSRGMGLTGAASGGNLPLKILLITNFIVIVASL
jgi:hypothetical protein